MEANFFSTSLSFLTQYLGATLFALVILIWSLGVSIAGQVLQLFSLPPQWAAYPQRWLMGLFLGYVLLGLLLSFFAAPFSLILFYLALPLIGQEQSFLLWLYYFVLLGALTELNIAEVGFSLELLGQISVKLLLVSGANSLLGFLGFAIAAGLFVGYAEYVKQEPNPSLPRFGDLIADALARMSKLFLAFLGAICLGLILVAPLAYLFSAYLFGIRLVSLLSLIASVEIGRAIFLGFRATRISLRSQNADLNTLIVIPTATAVLGLGLGWFISPVLQSLFTLST